LSRAECHRESLIGRLAASGGPVRIYVDAALIDAGAEALQADAVEFANGSGPLRAFGTQNIHID